MTKAEIYAAVTGLNDQQQMDPDLFDFFLDIAQKYWENVRPWVALRTEDTSQSVSPGNTFETQKSLPSDFRKWYTRFPVVLTDAQSNPQQFLTEVPLHTKTGYKNDNTHFYCNYVTKKLFICGNVGTALSIRQYYIKRSTKISADDNNTWELDVNDEFTSILPLSIVVYHKLGVDYDIINNSQAEANAALAKQIYDSQMVNWDAELAESALNGQDYSQGGQPYFGGDGMSGRAGFFI